MPLTADDVRNVTFSKPPMGKRGYDEDEVDLFLERVENFLRGRGLLSVSQVRQATFRLAPIGRRGYLQKEVDGFLGLIKAHMVNVIREPDGRPSSQDAAELSSIFSMPIEKMGLTVRSYNCLKREGIHTVGELVSRSDADLLDIRNFGAKSLDDVKMKLAGMGLALKEGPELRAGPVSERGSKSPNRFAGWLTGVVVHALPSQQRGRYSEEFAAELVDLAGQRWWRQWAHALRLVTRMGSLRRACTGRADRSLAREG